MGNPSLNFLFFRLLQYPSRFLLFRDALEWRKKKKRRTAAKNENKSKFEFLSFPKTGNTDGPGCGFLRAFFDVRASRESAKFPTHMHADPINPTPIYHGTPPPKRQHQLVLASLRPTPPPSRGANHPPRLLLCRSAASHPGRWRRRQQVEENIRTHGSCACKSHVTAPEAHVVFVPRADQEAGAIMESYNGSWRGAVSPTFFILPSSPVSSHRGRRDLLRELHRLTTDSAVFYAHGDPQPITLHHRILPKTFIRDAEPR